MGLAQNYLPKITIHNTGSKVVYRRYTGHIYFNGGLFSSII